LLLDLARAVTLRLKSCRTHGLILLSHLRLPEGQVSVFIYPRNRVAQLYPRALGSFFVIFYDSQGCGGGILTASTQGTIIDLYADEVSGKVHALTTLSPRENTPVPIV
jgi:hypothetical protein